jgi:hypothetical protein
VIEIDINVSYAVLQDYGNLYIPKTLVIGVYFGLIHEYTLI